MWNNYNSLATPPSTNDSIHLHNTSAVKHPTKHLSDIAHPYSAPTLSLLPFPKPRAAEKEERQWTWRPQRFSNSAREDYRRAGSDGSLKLRHWAKVPKRAPGEDEEMTPNDANSSEGEDDGPYPFAKYTPDNPIIQSYTEEEYIKFLEDSAESGWTKSETDYLFSLLKEYSGRFYIVLDRYEYAGTEEQPSAKRKIEDLKARYYSVVRKLIRARAGDDPEQIKAGESLILQYGFDYVGEKARREHISSLWDRTPQQIAEETLLYTELLRLSQTSTKFTAERHALLRLLAGIESGLPDVTTRDGRLEPLNQDPQIRGVKGGLWGNVLGGPTSAAPISTAQARKKRGTGAHAQSVDWTE
ncbi:swr complex subunit, partial [Serendipita sp. 405]